MRPHETQAVFDLTWCHHKHGLDCAALNCHNADMQNISFAMTRPLAFAGALPFVAAALLLLAGHSSVPVLGSVSGIAASYGLLILAFMAGVQWGQRLSGIATSLDLFLISNGIALAGWFAYLLLSQRCSLQVLWCCLLSCF
jgi:hypothetical protein